MASKARLSQLLSLFVHFGVFFISNHLSIAKDAILSGQVLSGDQTISSKGGVFELGFFTPGNSRNYYIGIWYKQVSKLTVVWVANREKPLSNKNKSQLKIDQDGNLVLLNQLKERVWSTNVDSIGANSTGAMLLDSGNLVLRDGLTSSAVVWQSIDHPTDTWLPNSWLGKNKLTGERQRIVSWRTWEDPAPGLFSLEIDPDGTNQYVLVWNGSRVYWTTGIWNGEGFALLPEMTGTKMFTFRFFDTENRSYFIYNPTNSSILTRNILEPSGQTNQCTWVSSSQQWRCFWNKPIAQCQVYSFCGAFGICTEKSHPFCSCLLGFKPRSTEDWNSLDWSGGCVRMTGLQCGLSSSDDEDKFWKIDNMRLPANEKLQAVRSAEECELVCLNDCSCTAYAYNNGCSVWNEPLMNLQQLANDEVGGRTLYVRLAASELKLLSPKKRRTSSATLGAVFGGVCVLAFTLLLIWRCRRQTKMMPLEVDGSSLVSFTYRDLQVITKNFLEKLGRGSFGTVYKGSLTSSTPVAVKKLEGQIQGEKQFRAEVSIIGTIQHINLIRLLGFCSQDINRLLVYDYMSNGSLDTHLFHRNHETLNWHIRYQIALGTARGLSYLHEKCRDCIIHCDIKPENILLDAEFCPKVSDFGMAKLVGRDFSRVLTSMRGTIGYLAPEWISGVAITPKADVFSYGMMLFEIISGRRNSEKLGDGDSAFFPCWAVRHIIKGDVRCLLDHRLEGEANMEELVRASRVACWCIQDDENDRPSMGQVVQMLEGVIVVIMPPIPSSIKVFIGNAT